MCRPLISKEAVQKREKNELIDKIFDGSADKLFAALLGKKTLSSKQIEKLKQVVDELEWGDCYELTANEFHRLYIYNVDFPFAPFGCKQAS